MKISIILFLISFSPFVSAQEDTLKPILSSIPSNNSEVTISVDLTKSERVIHHFLWRHAEITYISGIKRHKVVQRRRFLRNMFIGNMFDRRSNMKLKEWNEKGKLILRSTLKPYGTDGKRRSKKYTYHTNGKIKSRSINVKKGGCFFLVTKRSNVKEFDERGKRIRSNQVQ